MPITTTCSCGQAISVPDQAAGLSAKCPTCGATVKVPGTVLPAEVIDTRPRGFASEASGGDANGLMGWVWFVLIFGVGNLILYSTTGMYIIPLPRR